MPHSFGVPVASDFADTPPDHKFALYREKCGLWTMGEVQILAAAAQAFPGHWLDIGSHTGWTTAHMAAPGNSVSAVDPMLAEPEFFGRFQENTEFTTGIRSYGMTSEEWLNKAPARLQGACVDGDHTAPIPLNDAMKCSLRMLANDTGCIVLHDCMGQPVQDAAAWLEAKGWTVRVYPTVHGVAVCHFGRDFPIVRDAQPEMTITASFVRPRLGAIAKWSVF